MIADDINDYSEYLHYAEQIVLPLPQCAAYYRYITPKKICVSTYYGKAPCKGDGGGPLIYTDEERHGWKIFGVASGGHPEGCDKAFPFVYTRVSSYLRWILKNAGIAQ